MSDQDKKTEHSSDEIDFDGGLVLPGDEGFESAQSAAAEMEENGLETDEHQADEIREIFGTAFPQYLMPVEEIIEQIFSGTADNEAMDAIDVMITSLLEASSRMGFDDINKGLLTLQSNLAMVDVNAHPSIDSELISEINNSRQYLKNLANQMGGITEEDAEEEKSPTIFSALRNMEGIDSTALKRLSAAGVITVDQLLMARPNEIAAVSGLDMDTVHNILRHIQPDAPPVQQEAPPVQPEKPRIKSQKPQVKAEKSKTAKVKPEAPQVETEAPQVKFEPQVKLEEPRIKFEEPKSTISDNIITLSEAPFPDTSSAESITSAPPADLGFEKPEKLTAFSSGISPAEVPGEIELAHEKLLAQLRKEVETEAQVETLKQEVRSIKTGIKNKQYELHLIKNDVQKVTNNLLRLSKDITVQTSLLDKLNGQREALAHKYAVMAEETKRKEAKLKKLQQQRDQVEKEAANLSGDVDGIVNRLKRIKRTAAGGKRVQ